MRAIRYQVKSEQNVQQDPIPRGAMWSGGSGDSAGQLLVRVDDSHPYRGITHDEWGRGGKHAPPKHLLATGELEVPN